MSHVASDPDRVVTVTLEPTDPRVLRAAGSVLGAADPQAGGMPQEIQETVHSATQRGYFLPDEDDAIRARYSRFLGTRAVLLSSLAAMEDLAGGHDATWQRRLPAFAVALAATCQLVRDTSAWVELASSSRILRKKLDEPDASHGVPRKTFARLYRANTATSRRLQFQHALRFYQRRHPDFDDLRTREPYDRILGLIDGGVVEFVSGPGRVWRERLRYRWFSFRRRHHSAWKNTVFEIFRWSGSLIADLRQPGVKAPDAPKRVTAELREQALGLARPGDVFVTRHDDAVSNLFLPGFWPHAALHLGSQAERDAIGLRFSPPHQAAATDPIRFLESKKDGVRLRPPDDTLQVDAFVILRPPLESDDLNRALNRAMSHHGKLYDFVFDFRRSDRLACTELVYRAYHQCGPLAFTLQETGGRLCLPAEELIQQALEQGFEVVASCGIGAGGILTGMKAELALHQTRAGL